MCNKDAPQMHVCIIYLKVSFGARFLYAVMVFKWTTECVFTWFSQLKWGQAVIIAFIFYAYLEVFSVCISLLTQSLTQLGAVIRPQWKAKLNSLLCITFRLCICFAVFARHEEFYIQYQQIGKIWQTRKNQWRKRPKKHREPRFFALQ